MIGFSLFGYMVDTSIERKNGLSQSVAPCPQLSLYESYTILSLLSSGLAYLIQKATKLKQISCQSICFKLM